MAIFMASLEFQYINSKQHCQWNEWMEMNRNCTQPGARGLAF